MLGGPLGCPAARSRHHHLYEEEETDDVDFRTADADLGVRLLSDDPSSPVLGPGISDLAGGMQE